MDKQIKRVFEDVGEKIYRTTSGKNLMAQLNQASPRLLCTLIHKFGQRKSGNGNFDAFIAELQNAPNNIVGEICSTAGRLSASQISPLKISVGELFVFVDECHRIQSNKLHKTMKAILRNAIFIGFTGTPLLKQDKQTTMEVFGKYIHTYKMNEAVQDGVILDLTESLN